jgi:hypothetical protein
LLSKYIKARITKGIKAKIIEGEVRFLVKREGYQKDDCIFWEPGHNLVGDKPFLDWLEKSKDDVLKV